MLICGIEVWPLRRSDLKVLDFVVDSFFGNMEIIRLSQQMFCFELPSLLIEKRGKNLQ